MSNPKSGDPTNADPENGDPKNEAPGPGDESTGNEKPDSWTWEAPETRVRQVLFAPSRRAEPWHAIDDRVMGGVSQSRFEIYSDSAVFVGRLSLEQGGGFASVRSEPGRHDLTGAQGIVMPLRGDGRRYRFRLRTTESFDDVSYEAPFDTAETEWIEVRLPLPRFRPVYRGRVLEDHPPLDPAEVKTLGFLVSDRQEGVFRLEVAWIGAYEAAAVN